MRLVDYPFVILRISCRACRREGQYRLARLAEAHGAEIDLEALRARLTADCPGWRQTGKRRRPVRLTDCHAVFPDIQGPPIPPDLPPGLAKLRLVAGGRDDDAA